MNTYQILIGTANKPDWSREADGVRFQAPNLPCARKISVCIMQSLYSMYYAIKPPKVKIESIVLEEDTLSLDICFWEVVATENVLK